MTSILRPVIFFIVQFAGVTATMVVAGAMVALYRHGVGYAQTTAFSSDLHFFVKIGVAVAFLFCTVLFCYHLTRKDAQASHSNDPDIT